MNTPACHIDILDWLSASDLAMPLRIAVFVTEQGVPPEIETDAFDPVCLHAVARTPSGEVIGTGRLCKEGEQGYIGRMAVAARWRKHSIGSQILNALIRTARSHNLTQLTLHAQVHATAFYARHGFTAHGPVFMEAGIPHQEMTRNLFTS